MKSICILLLCIPLTIVSAENVSSHQDNELWHCDTFAAIPRHKVCDGQRDCNNGRDETIEQCLRKQCAETQYRCAYGACIPAALKCNRRTDCADASDETSFLCAKDVEATFRQVQGDCDSGLQIQCHTGECIMEDERCDGTVDCTDGSDESVAMCAHLSCPHYAFRCAYGGCIAGFKYCDGIRDCADGSDELCELSRRAATVPPVQFQLRIEQPSAMPLGDPCRIPQHAPNLRITLRDEDDIRELQYMDHVALDATVHFSCLYNFRLEGAAELTCQRGSWFKDWPKCIPPDDQPKCQESQWRCISGDCIDQSALCNGAKDCQDGSDETVDGCIKQICADGEYRCAYGACVNETSVCNGAADCADGSDETKFVCSHNKSELWTQLQGTCNSSIYVQCACGDCISEDYLCDGLAQCPDSSDESVAMCAHIGCPFNAFRCGYGACIDGSVVCDGKADCHDGSDEAPTLCASIELELDEEYDGDEWAEDLDYDQWEDHRWTEEAEHTAGEDTTLAAPVTSAPFAQCSLPLDRPHLLMENTAANVTLPGGSKVDPTTVVRFRCADGWQLVGGEPEAMCLAGDDWTSAPPQCEKYCDSAAVTRGLSTSAECYYNQQHVDCASSLRAGTVAEVQCASGYNVSKLRGAHTTLTCDADGEWDYAKFKCTPACAEPLDYEQPSDKAPYHVAIYRLIGMPSEQQQPFVHEFECHGAIITPKIVLTAASCFSTVRAQPTVAVDPLMFKVVVDAHLDVFEEERAHNVSEILMLESPPIETSDILAAVVLAKYIVVGPTAMPICLDFQKYACFDPLEYLTEIAATDHEQDFSDKLGTVATAKSRNEKTCLVLVGQTSLWILDYFLQPIELQLMRYNYLL